MRGGQLPTRCARKSTSADKAREPGSGGACGGRMKRQRQGRCGSTLLQLVRTEQVAPARGVSITRLAKASHEQKTMCPADGLPKLATRIAMPSSPYLPARTRRGRPLEAHTEAKRVTERKWSHGCEPEHAPAVGVASRRTPSTSPEGRLTKVRRPS